MIHSTTLNAVITQPFSCHNSQGWFQSIKFYLFSVALAAPADGYKLCVEWKENL